MPDWNAVRYQQLSGPQQAWGRRVLDRLALDGHERVLDVGCGTGQITAEIAARVPEGRVVGVDVSPAMVETAHAWLRLHAPAVRVALADAAALPFRRGFDAIFSGATFHWVLDHAALFRSLITALRPGGRLVAQCGGGANIAVLVARANELVRGRYGQFFEEWHEPWYFADVESTRRKMAAAGFIDIDVSLEPEPTAFPDATAFSDFIAHVCVRHHVGRLPLYERRDFLHALTSQAAADQPAFTLDYWRLNLAGRRPA